MDVRRSDPQPSGTAPNDAERLQRATRMARLLVGVWDRVADVVSVSGDVRELLGMDQPLTGARLAACIAPDDLARLLAETSDALARGDACGGEVGFRRPDTNDTICLEWHAEAVRDDAGNVVRLEGVCVDVSKRREAEDRLREREQQIELVTDAMPALISYVDASLRYVFVNRQYESWYGLRREEVVGRTMPEVMGEERYAPIRGYVGAALRGERVHFEMEFPYMRAGRLWIDVRYVPHRSPSGRVAGFFALVVDATERKRAENAVRESNARYRELMQQAPFSVQVLAPDGHTLSVNRAWEELWGLTLEQLRDYNMLLDRQLEDKGVLPYIRRAFAGEAVRIPAIRYDPNETIPNRSQHADPARWVAAVAYPLKDPTGHVREVVLMHEDITARRRAELALSESADRLRLVHHAAAVGAWEWNAETNAVFWSDEYRAVYGLPAEADPSFDAGIASVLDEDRERVLTEVQEALAAGREFRSEHRIRHPSLGLRWVMAIGKAVDHPGTPRRLMGVAFDITERRRAEEALIEADRRKDEFIATLSHELRNPLAPLRNALHLLRHQPGGEAGELHAMMERQVNHLVRLVDDLLDMSRINRGTFALRRERVELGAVVRNAIDTSAPFMNAAGHRLEVTLPHRPVWLDGDAVRLSQIIANLLNNAARYTDPGGRVAIRASAEGTMATIAVEDNGRGIAPALREHLFEMFARAPGSEGSEGGLGIGLALARRLARMHGGEVTVASDGPGKGSTFTVRLPVAATGAATVADAVADVGATTAPAGAPIRPLRVLVVDDNRDAADSLAMVLQLLGADVRVAHDGRAAIRDFASHDPSVVLLDIGMPEMDGYEVARRLRDSFPGHRAAIVALTGWGQENDRRRAQAAGFDHHLIKPVEIATLESLLQRLDLQQDSGR